MAFIATAIDEAYSLVSAHNDSWNMNRTTVLLSSRYVYHGPNPKPTEIKPRMREGYTHRSGALLNADLPGTYNKLTLQ